MSLLSESSAGATGGLMLQAQGFRAVGGRWGNEMRGIQMLAADASELLDLSHASDDAADMQAMRRALSSKLLISKQTENVEILRQRPNNPLFSVKTFEELRLPESLLFGLYDLNFRAPSRIQETALPILLANP